MFRQISLGLLLITIVLTITACGGGGGDGGTAAVSSVSGATVTGKITGEGSVANLAVFLIAANQAPVLPTTGIQADIAGSYYSTVTDAEGSFAFQNVEEGVYNVQAQGQGFQSAIQANVAVIRANTITVNLKLTATGELDGYIRVPSGSDPLGTIAFVAGTSYLAMADTTGYYKISGIPSGTYSLSYSGKGFAVQTQTAVTVVGGTKRTLADVTLSFGEAFNVVVTGSGQLKGGLKATYEAKLFGAAVGPFTYAWTATAGAFISGNAQKSEWTAPTTSTGMVNVECTVTDARGASAKGALPIEVLSAANQAPRVTVTGPTTVNTGSASQYLVTAADPEGEAVTFEWLTPSGGSYAGGTTSQIATWTAPGTAGTIQIQCRATDAQGASSTASLSVQVKNFGLAPSLWRFNVCIGGTQLDEAYSVDRDSSGNFYVAGKTNSPQLFGLDNVNPITGYQNYGLFDGFVAKIGPDGTPVWAKSVGGDKDDFCSKVRALPDGGCVVFGGTNSSGTGIIPSGLGSQDVFVAKFDGNGNLGWGGVKVFGGNSGDQRSDSAMDLEIDPAGRIVLLGSNYSGSHYPFLRVYDTSGTLIVSSWDVGQQVGSPRWTSGLGFAANGNYVFVMTADNDEMKMVEISPTTLNVVSSLNLKPAPGPGGYYPGIHDLINTGGNDFYAAGATTIESGTSDQPGKDGSIIKINTATTTIAIDRHFGEAAYEDDARCVKLTADGGFVAAGWSQRAAGLGFLDSRLSRYDKAGNHLWDVFHGGSDSDRTYEVVNQGDSVFTLAGYTLSADGQFIGITHGNSDAFIAQVGY